MGLPHYINKNGQQLLLLGVMIEDTIEEVKKETFMLKPNCTLSKNKREIVFVPQAGYEECKSIFLKYCVFLHFFLNIYIRLANMWASIQRIALMLPLMLALLNRTNSLAMLKGPILKFLVAYWRITF